ncbi:hypothetical protein HMPREF1868_00253 [Olsenella sp. DNF00959]|nr:hypothetical protein HMPREF1868_00253 [Olsenella sp. DNF00959]
MPLPCTVSSGDAHSLRRRLSHSRHAPPRRGAAASPPPPRRTPAPLPPAVAPDARASPPAVAPTPFPLSFSMHSPEMNHAPTGLLR